MKKKDTLVFSPEIPADLEHAPLIREEAVDWLETHYPGETSFLTANVLRMAGEPHRRWLIGRLRAHDIGNEAEFSVPDAADALTVLFLRARGVKFRDAIDAVAGNREPSENLAPRYGGVWNRLLVSALEGIRRRVPARLLASAIFALLRDSGDHVNCLVIVKRQPKPMRTQTKEPIHVSHDYVYRLILERPSPSCVVVSPSREVMFFSKEQLPARSEITSRHFTSLQITSELESYELLLGTMKPTKLIINNPTSLFVSKVLDIVYPCFEKFLQTQLTSKPETPVQPEQSSASDLQLWEITQFLSSIYPGSLSEISEMSSSARLTKVLASSVSNPWEPSPWEPAKSLEMLSGYSSKTGVPLIIEKAEPPWTMIIEGIEAELRYLRSKKSNDEAPKTYSALAIPVVSSLKDSIGVLYILMPSPGKARIDTEVRILSVFSRIIGETIERHRSAIYSADVSANIVSQVILDHDQFRAELEELLNRQSLVLEEELYLERDVRLPFILVAAHSTEIDEKDAVTLRHLKSWLVETLRHLEWRSLVKSRGIDVYHNRGTDGFIGDVHGIGIMIALGKLVSKDELDQIRSAFPTAFNRTYPSNSPVKLVSWVLDVPAQRIADAAKAQKLPGLADEIEGWALDVATLVDDLAQSSTLRDEGEWDAALRRVRQALQKPGARNNSYLRRLATECSLALADWPGALKYAQEAVALSGNELGSGKVRSLCLAANANLCLCNPLRSWDLYSEAASKSPYHPLPRYYRGHALLLMARLLRTYEDEQRRSNLLEQDKGKRIESVLEILSMGGIQDLTSAADLLDKWGLIPEAYQYRNFHLVPTLLGQGMFYQLNRTPGPAASRLQSARRFFPKNELFFREFLFTKCWEQGVHRQYATVLLGDNWVLLREKITATFGEPVA